MWELDHKEGWVPKYWCFQPVVLKTLESPLYYEEIKPDNSKRNQWILIGRTDVEVEASVLWPPALKSRVIRKAPDAGKDWRQEQKGAPEDDTVRWHPWFNRHEFEQAPGDGERQGNLVCCSPWGHKEWDTTEWLNNSNLRKRVIFGERGWYWESVQPLGFQGHSTLTKLKRPCEHKNQYWRQPRPFENWLCSWYCSTYITNIIISFGHCEVENVIELHLTNERGSE